MVTGPLELPRGENIFRSALVECEVLQKDLAITLKIPGFSRDFCGFLRFCRGSSELSSYSEPPSLPLGAPLSSLLFLARLQGVLQ